MTAQPRKQTTAIQILSKISKRKDNQAIKFGQLIEYNIRNIFVKNYTQNVEAKLFPDSFVKNQNSAYLWINNSLVLYSLLLLFPKLRTIEIF